MIINRLLYPISVVWNLFPYPKLIFIFDTYSTKSKITNAVKQITDTWWYKYDGVKVRQFQLIIRKQRKEINEGGRNAIC